MALATAAGDVRYEQLVDLESRIASVMGVLNATSAELVSLVAEVLGTDVWQGVGIRSPEHWLTWQCGLSSARASSLVATARGLGELPRCRERFEAGALSEDQARVIAQCTDAAHDAEVSDLAPLCTVSQLRHALRTIPVAEPKPEPEPAGPRREVSFGYGEDGWFWSRIRLRPEEGAVFETALCRARDAEFALRHPNAEGDPRRPSPGDLSWADGLLRMAEASLSNLDPGAGRPGERFCVYVHVDADAPYSSYLHLGPPLSERVAQYVACDASIRIVLEANGKVVALSQRQDTVDTKTRKLVEDRDGGCCIPGCGQRRWLHVHHILHRSTGGRTVLENLCCLCPLHHRMHHRGDFTITGDPTTPGGLAFSAPDGRDLGPGRPRPPNEAPAEAAARLGIAEGRYLHPLG
ncbi:MAG: HNH endonuclease, partial [Actinomycetota bacterium]|nr:HNH endonuclease [Actinomycetota bacterium]